MVFLADVVLCVWLPKSIEVGARPTAGAVATPVPVKESVTDATPPVKGWVNVALRLPAPPGMKVTE